MRERLAVLIDGTNFYDTMKALNRKADYNAIRTWINTICPTNIVNYYSAVYTDETGFSNLRSLLDWMQYNGIRTITKPTKTLVNEAGTYLKGNMDIEIAVDACRMARYYDQIMLFSGDGDFTYLVHELQRAGTYIHIVSAAGDDSQKNFCSDSLRRAADRFYNIKDQPWFSAAHN